MKAYAFVNKVSFWGATLPCLQPAFRIGEGKYSLWAGCGLRRDLIWPLVGPLVLHGPGTVWLMVCPATPRHTVGLGRLHSWNKFLGSSGSQGSFHVLVLLDQALRYWQGPMLTAPPCPAPTLDSPRLEWKRSGPAKIYVHSPNLGPSYTCSRLSAHAEQHSGWGQALPAASVWSPHAVCPAATICCCHCCLWAISSAVVAVEWNHRAA